MLGTAIVFPLDTIKSLMQASSEGALMLAEKSRSQRVVEPREREPGALCPLGGLKELPGWGLAANWGADPPGGVRGR